jgi:NTE family protein
MTQCVVLARSLLFVGAPEIDVALITVQGLNGEGEVSARHGRQTEKAALVLASGGFTGSGYEVGALQALDELLVDRTVNDFDIFVGTSAGALVGTFLANGVSPTEIRQLVEGGHPRVQPLQGSDILEFDKGGLFRWGLQLPSALLRKGLGLLQGRRGLTSLDALWSLLDETPAGLYDSMVVERAVREILKACGRSNRFTELERELYIIATDLQCGERAVFGQKPYRNVSISLAVAASTAVPMLYKPVRIGNREYVDGVMRGTASLDLAIEQGATLIVCINPLVPYRMGSNGEGGRTAYLSERGMQAVVNQVTRINAQANLHYHIKQLRRLHPEVDILLIEPRADNRKMFEHNPMCYAAGCQMIQHGFESVTIELGERYSLYARALARGGFRTTPRLGAGELTQLRQSNYNSELLRQMMARSKPRKPVTSLGRTLVELETTLGQFSDAA